MYRYRCEQGTTRKALNRLKFLQKLGTIIKIQGKRFLSKKKDYAAIQERVFVKGTNGTARFDGFCWSYQGEGPHGLVQLLQAAGVDPTTAKNTAFHAPRGQNPGVDWEINIPQ